jgi:hypothetical protein
MTRSSTKPAATVETDHEFKTRMAAEGRAIYVPGKTAEEAKAAKAAKAAALVQPLPRRLILTKEEWSGLDTAIPDVIEAIADVRALFHDLAYSDALDQPWVNAAMRLAGRAFISMERHELSLLDRLDRAIRDSSKERVEA